MTEDILFDNIYIGHSVEDAKAFQAETFDVKKPLESAQSKAKKVEDIDEDEEVSFREDPVEFLRAKIFKFVDLARLDPVLAFKTQPETGAALALSVITLFGMLGAMFGLVGASQKPVTKVNLYARWSMVVNHDAYYSRQRKLMPLHLMINRRLRLRPSPPQVARRQQIPL